MVASAIPYKPSVIRASVATDGVPIKTISEISSVFSPTRETAEFCRPLLITNSEVRSNPLVNSFGWPWGSTNVEDGTPRMFREVEGPEKSLNRSEEHTSELQSPC